MKARPLATFFVLAYAISWSFWAPAVLARLGLIGSVPTRYLHLAGGLGPMLAAIAVTAMGGGRPALTRLGRRCLIGRHWLIIAVLIPAALFFAATALITAAYGEAVDWSRIGRSAEFPEFAMPLHWMASLIFYGFGEEVGWRGLAPPEPWDGSAPSASGRSC